ncbi:hypothetical protein B0H34DRAFT_462313 [Crassisporium funariophilum]|nr:hypothetical protein B0H34DRAFT_462313 [Crassisporium funariophilum]
MSTCLKVCKVAIFVILLIQLCPTTFFGRLMVTSTSYPCSSRLVIITTRRSVHSPAVLHSYSKNKDITLRVRRVALCLMCSLSRVHQRTANQQRNDNAFGFRIPMSTFYPALVNGWSLMHQALLYFQNFGGHRSLSLVAYLHWLL